MGNKSCKEPKVLCTILKILKIVLLIVGMIVFACIGNALAIMKMEGVF